MIRFGGQGDKRGDKKRGRRGRRKAGEGRREGTAAAARRVYTRRCVVDRVFILMSLAEDAELAHADARARTVAEGTHAHTCTHAKTHAEESDGIL